MTGQHPDERDETRLTFDIFRSIDRLRLSTWLTVVLERLWPLLLPLLLVIAIFLCLSWFGIFRIIPDFVRFAVLGLFVLSLPACLYLLSKFRLPDHRKSAGGWRASIRSIISRLPSSRKNSPPTRMIHLRRRCGTNTENAWLSVSGI